MLPSQLVLMRVGAPLWLAVIVVGWGITAMAFALMQTRWVAITAAEHSSMTRPHEALRAGQPCLDGGGK